MSGKNRNKGFSVHNFHFYNFVEIKVRGLCQRSKFDSSYEVMNDDRGYLGYKGLRNTRVSFDPDRRKMYLVNNPNITAVSNASMESLIMGNTVSLAIQTA